MFPQLLAFELRGHVRRRPVTWLYVAILFLPAFFALGSDAIVVGSALGKVERNSPYNLANMFALLLAVGQVVTGALVSSAVLRDFEAGVHELACSPRSRRTPTPTPSCDRCSSHA